MIDEDPKSPLTWAEVVAASQGHEQKTAATPARSPFPGSAAGELRPGDLIDHEKLGRATVYKIQGSCLHLVSKSGKNLRLSRDAIRLEPVGIEDGQRLFRATT
jgi:hypothetical protein